MGRGTSDTRWMEVLGRDTCEVGAKTNNLAQSFCRGGSVRTYPRDVRSVLPRSSLRPIAGCTNTSPAPRAFSHHAPFPGCDVRKPRTREAECSRTSFRRSAATICRASGAGSEATPAAVSASGAACERGPVAMWRASRRATARMSVKSYCRVRERASDVPWGAHWQTWKTSEDEPAA